MYACFEYVIVALKAIKHVGKKIMDTILSLIAINVFVIKYFTMNEDEIKLLTDVLNVIFPTLFGRSILHSLVDHPVQMSINDYTNDFNVMYQRNNFRQNDQVNNVDETIKTLQNKIIDLIKFHESGENQCAICMDNINRDENIYVTECCHIFHNECINNVPSNPIGHGSSSRETYNCPMCRHTCEYKYRTNIFTAQNNDENTNEAITSEHEE